MAGNYGVGQPKRSLFDRAMDAITPAPKQEPPPTPPPQNSPRKVRPGDAGNLAPNIDAIRRNRKQLEDASK
jgi:hypothetical protein